jgi:hydroxymethylglutaryl-CoA reductase
MSTLWRLRHDGPAQRAVALALAAAAAVITGHPGLVPYAVAVYAVANAIAVTRAAARRIAATPTPAPARR